ncbi:MAG: hypothetical protein IJZ87_06460 [Bacteroidales bacterium]|nr:hypothetical protein [Bacteroidales bacterium]
MAIDLPTQGIIVLGNMLNDPYKFENMLQARNQLANERSSINTPTIRATHKYMRYRPQNDEELDLLKADTNLLLWDYPLHYEITVNGTHYHDPSIADSLPTWQYFVVTNDYQLPTLSSKCELIYTLYFPDEDSSDTFYDDLEERAYLITGNLADDEDMRASSWTPSAVIKAGLLLLSVAWPFIIIIQNCHLTEKNVNNLICQHYIRRGFLKISHKKQYQV